MKLALHVLLLVTLAWGCALAEEKVTVVVPSQASPRILYGAERLVKVLGGKAVLSKSDTAPGENAIVIGRVKEDRLVSDTVARLRGRMPALPADNQEAYWLWMSGERTAVVAGSGDSGVLYGCLELARMIEAASGLPAPSTTKADAPRLVLRGPCIGLQRPEIKYDGQMYDYLYTPEDFPWFYDKALWTKYLDLLVECRFNSLYLWNGHPFTSILKLEKYPDAQELSDEQLQRNIEQFNWLCQEADRRGIWVIQFFYNIHISHALAKSRKIAMRLSKPTPLASEYTRYCISEFVRNYPHVGLMMCLGEALADDYDAEWLTQTIIPGVKDGLKPGQPLPPIIVRAHSTPIVKDLEAAAPLYSNIYTMKKYTSETLASDHVATSKTLTDITSKYLMIINVHCVCNLEPFRWGSPRFVQTAVKSCLDAGIRGLHLYPLRYWDWPYTADRVPTPLLQMDRDWLWFEVWGRYAWNPDRSPDEERAYWTARLAEKYGPQAAGKILEAYEESGDVMPRIVQAFSAEAWNIEAHTLGQTMGQFLNSRRWFAPPGLSIREYATALVRGQKIEGETPDDVGREIVTKAEAAVKAADEAAPLVAQNREEFDRLRNDMIALRHIANFYNEKAQAAVAALLFERKPELTQLEPIVSHLQRSVEEYRALTTLTDRTYTDAVSRHDAGRQIPMPGPKYLVWRDVLPEFEKELRTLEANVAYLKSHPEKLIPPKPFPPVDFTCKSAGFTVYTVGVGAKPYTDRAYILSEVPPELAGLRSVTFPNSKARRGPVPITLQAKDPVRVFLAPGERNWDWAGPQKGWTLYRKGALTVGIRTSDIYYKDFPAGELTIQFEKGTFVLAGVTRADIPMPRPEDFLSAEGLFTQPPSGAGQENP